MQTPTLTSEQLLKLVETSLEDMKVRDLVTLDVRGKSSVTDFMVIASGSSNRHVKASADAVVRAVKEAGMQPLGVEGLDSAEWALVDLGDLVVHVMQVHARDFYDLERLWGPDAVSDDDAADTAVRTGEPKRR